MELIVDFPRRQNSPRRGLQVLFTDKSQFILFKKAPPEHWNDLWYTKRELLSFRLESKELMLKKVREVGNMQGPTEYENYLKSPPLDHRQIHNRVILSEQRRQFLAGVVRDPNALARISEANSEWCVKIARMTALVHHVSCLTRDS